MPILSKKRNIEERMGQGTFERCWKEIKELCSIKKGYWGNKNITWYSFRHTGISLCINRGISPIQLSRLAGTGLANIEQVYYHHEAESKATWEALSQNRIFFDRLRKEETHETVQFEKMMDGV